MNTQIPKHITPNIASFTKYLLENKEKISTETFAEEFGNVQRLYLMQHQRDLFCHEADELANIMTEEQCTDFAGIIISSLCKLTQFVPYQQEYFALKGLKIAEANNDPIHIMSRLNDLRKVYYRKPNKLYQYIQVLYKQEKCLKRLIDDYDSAVESYQTVKRKPAPKRDYELMLAHVQTEIGKLIKKKHPEEAREKLISAKQTFEQRGYRQNVEYINMLLNEITV